MKRLVQEVRNVEAPLSPSSDCHNVVQPLSLCDVQPSSVAAGCSSLIADDSQSADVSVPLLHIIGSNAGASLLAGAVSSDNTHMTVTSSLDAHGELLSDTFSSTLSSCGNVESTDADKMPVRSAGDEVSSSCDVAGVLPASDIIYLL